MIFRQPGNTRLCHGLPYPWFHKWVIIRNNHRVTYFKCKHCGERAVEKLPGVYQPVDFRWLHKGKWMGKPIPPKGGTGAVRANYSIPVVCIADLDEL